MPTTWPLVGRAAELADAVDLGAGGGLVAGRSPRGAPGGPGGLAAAGEDGP